MSNHATSEGTTTIHLHEHHKEEDGSICFIASGWMPPSSLWDGAITFAPSDPRYPVIQWVLKHKIHFRSYLGLQELARVQEWLDQHPSGDVAPTDLPEGYGRIEASDLIVEADAPIAEFLRGRGLKFKVTCDLPGLRWEYIFSRFPWRFRIEFKNSPQTLTFYRRLMFLPERIVGCLPLSPATFRHEIHGALMKL